MRYDFQLPEFTRMVWVSNHAREVWEPRIKAISNAWIQIERLGVLSGAKPAALQVVSPEELVPLSVWAHKNGLVCIPLQTQGLGSGYTNSTPAIVDGKFGYRVVITNQTLGRIFCELWERQDNEAIGAALGFPICCREFFEKYWVKEGWRDLTFPMVMGEVDVRELRVGGAMECNILLRWLGVRLVSHLPCSFYCDASQAVGERLGLLGLKHGYVNEMDWLTQMLNWPVRWTSLHGVATITTPIFRVITDTTAVSEKLVIDRDGSNYPVEGARGTEFPFKHTHTLTVRRANDYTDNGFNSLGAMEHAHSVILRAVSKAFDEGQEGRILDLGCGNGKLLESIIHVCPWVIPCGVEIEEGRFQRAARRLLEHDPDLHHCSLFDEHFWNPPYRLALISVNRLEEVEVDKARELVIRLRDSCEKVIVYSYDRSEWPGVTGLGIAEYFWLTEQFTGDSVCALLLTPKRNNDQDPVQR